MASDPLSVESILQHMADALPTHAANDSNSDLSSSYEAIALFSHACMTALGFRLLGFSEAQKTESDCQRLAPRLSTRWNSVFGSHSFLYAHSQSSMQYVIKVDRLGGKAEVRGVGLGDEKISRFEITAKDYVSSAALPLRIQMGESGEDRSNLVSKLWEVFISASRIKDLASLFKITIIQKLMPNLQKEGYEEVANTEGAAERDRVSDQREEDHARQGPRRDPLREGFLPQPARPYPFDDPLAVPPRRPPMGDFPPPDFEDEYEINRPPQAIGQPRMPFGIGHDDLNPPGLGPNDPLRGSLIGGNGLPRPGFEAGGMHPTFDDPLFGGQRDQRAYNPRAPLGSRYDPVGPGDGPLRGNGGRFFGDPGTGGPPSPFSGFGNNDFI